MLITTNSYSEDPLVQWLARGAVTTGRLRLANSKVTGSNPVWVELFAFWFPCIFVLRRRTNVHD